jgi:flavin-dependent dehydrogenase
MVANKLAYQNNDRAIVIGGSIAGLLVARVLADYFETVTIIERDKLPIQPLLKTYSNLLKGKKTG